MVDGVFQLVHQVLNIIVQLAIVVCFVIERVYKLKRCYTGTYVEN